MKRLSIPKYKIKSLNKDFIVTEVPIIPRLTNAGNSKYTYLWVVKNGVTSFEAQEEIKKYFNLDYSEINLEGLKDEDAVTSQIFSVKRILSELEIADFNKFMRNKTRRDIVIDKIIGRGKSAVKERYLHGNTFEVVVRGLSAQVAKRLKSFCGERTSFSFINYYDSQRFGMPGGPYNSHIIGKKIIEGNWTDALDEIIMTQDSRGIKHIVNQDSRDIKRIFDSFNPSKIRFYINSYSSNLWNQDASARIGSLNSCRKITFDNVASLFIPLKPNYISSSQLGSDGFDFDTKKKKVIKKRKNRSLVTHTVVYSSDVRRDSLDNKKKAITLSFLLPTGCYATMMIRQLMFYSCLR